MKRIYSLMFVMAVVLTMGSSSVSAHDHEEMAGKDSAAVTETVEAKQYFCPMHPDVQSAMPGKCTECGMDLEKKTEEPAPATDGHEGHTH